MSGVFQIDRDLFNNNIWQNPAEFRLFFYILGNAVWKEEGVKIGNVLVKRGQYLRSYRNLREDLMYMDNNAIKYYSLSHIKKIIDKLIDDGRLKKEETELGTLFTIVNYSKYQWDSSLKSNNREQSENGERTEQEQNENNKNKDNKDNNTTTIITGENSQDENFVARVGADPTKQANQLRELESYYLTHVRKRTMSSSNDLIEMVHAYETYKDLDFIIGVIESATKENVVRNGKCKINSFSYFTPILQERWEEKLKIEEGRHGANSSKPKPNPAKTFRFTEEDAQRAGVTSL